MALRQVFKYPMGGESSHLAIPGRNPRIVHVEVVESGFFPTVWVEHELADTTTVLELIVHGTGHIIHEGWEHVGTSADPAMPLVWHVYRKEPG